MGVPKQKSDKAVEAYRSIGEAARELDLPTHVLRYWETRFPRYVRPVKRPDGRRFYRKSDMDGLRAIQTLVHRRGMTLKGAKALLHERGVDIVLSGEQVVGTILTGSPVHDLQSSVTRAFSGREPSRGSLPSAPLDLPDGEHGSTERLEAMLDRLSLVKRRLDEVRQHPVP